ncbi:hypothetical protein PPERSA_03221 [Pseudocohnilembus persalinus]|uniref:Uncharacterized protein n=1 Tax=Pseudocohnilembus persalinus TaxID=266149 RepID=A0A0V0QE79_PSEPJ|nr:hypothetical protein PPERSA_03221 [Pseudocohnilembus persalinus]|eukprot:KRX00488.1 hypothetical protein PPERSA_03221 [Pseudocohnilembus persalinus]
MDEFLKFLNENDVKFSFPSCNLLLKQYQLKQNKITENLNIKYSKKDYKKNKKINQHIAKNNFSSVSSINSSNSFQNNVNSFRSNSQNDPYLQQQQQQQEIICEEQEEVNNDVCRI